MNTIDQFVTSIQILKIGMSKIWKNNNHKSGDPSEDQPNMEDGFKSQIILFY